MKYLLSSGCSFSIPRPHLGIHTCVGKEIANYKQLQHLNIAEPSSGNTRIIANTKIFYEKYPERKKDTFALVQFSYGGRLDYIKKSDNNNLKMNTVNIVREHLSTSKIFTDADLVEWTAFNFYNSVLDMQNYLKQNDIPYYFYNGMQSVVRKPKSYLNNIIDAIDQNYFFNLHDQDTVHYKWCEDRDFLIPNDLHPNNDGVQQYAKLLQDKIKHI